MISSVSHESFAQPALQWQLARDLTKMCVEYQEEPFQLRAGGESNWYVDARIAIMHNFFGPILASAMYARMVAHAFDLKGIVGMGIGGTALARSLSWVSGLPVTEASNADADDRYPRGLYGNTDPGTEFTIVDDTLMTGSSIEETAELVVEHDGRIAQICTVVDRSDGMAINKLRKAYGVEVWSLFSFEESAGQLVPFDLR